MPKRVKSLVLVTDNETTLNSLSDNELVITSTGLGLKYDTAVYEFNGNKKMMDFIESKQNMGADNKDLEDNNLYLDQSTIVTSIDNENKTTKEGKGAYLLNE